MENSLLTDERKECYLSLKFTYEMLQKCRDDSYYWKWVIIGIHNSLQNFMVTALRDTSGTNILKDNLQAKYYDSLRKGDYNVKEILNNFLNLYRDIKSDEMLHIFESKKYIPDGNDDEEIKKLNYWRNKFVHFIPMGLGIYLQDIIDMFFVAVKIMKFLSKESRNFILLFDEKKLSLSREILSKIQLLLEEYKPLIQVR